VQVSKTSGRSLLVNFTDSNGDPKGVKALIITVKLKAVIFTAKWGELFTSFVLQRPNGDLHRFPSDQCETSTAGDTPAGVVCCLACRQVRRYPLKREPNRQRIPVVTDIRLSQ